MGCPCNSKIATLRCKNCGTMITVSYGKGEEPLQVAVKNGRRCKKCTLQDWEVAGK